MNCCGGVTWGGWKLLARSRLTGRWTTRGCTRFGFGIPPAPEPNRLVIAEVRGAGPESLLEKARVLIYRGILRKATFDHGGVVRLITGTAPDGLLMTVPGDADCPVPWNLAQNSTTIRFDRDPGFAGSNGPLEIGFYSVPIVPLGTQSNTGPLATTSESTKASLSITGGLNTNG